jgi:hypothetical protein
MTLKQALMNGQDLTAEEADDLIAEMREQVNDGANPEHVLYDEGLEPDYVFDLITL